MSCDVGEVTERLENELCYDSTNSAHSPTYQSLHLHHNLFSKLRHFTYVTIHSPTLPSLYLSNSSFYNPSVALPTSQLILQPFRCFTYVTAHSPTLLSLFYVTGSSVRLRHLAISPCNMKTPRFELGTPVGTDEAVLLLGFKTVANILWIKEFATFLVT